MGSAATPVLTAPTFGTLLPPGQLPPGMPPPPTAVPGVNAPLPGYNSSGVNVQPSPPATTQPSPPAATSTSWLSPANLISLASSGCVAGVNICPPGIQAASNASYSVLAPALFGPGVTWSRVGAFLLGLLFIFGAIYLFKPSGAAGLARAGTKAAMEALAV